MIILRQHNFSLVSKGVRFIKELRTIDPLPISIEEYEKFLYGEVRKRDDGSFYNTEVPEIEEIKKKLSDYYRSPRAAKLLVRIGRAFCEGCFPTRPDITKEIDKKTKKYYDAVKFSYDKINRLPKRYISDSIGNGAYGIVFNYPLGKIEKIGFLGFSTNEYRFYDYLLKHNLKVFPKVYDLEKDQVIMEKLKTDTPKVNEYRGYIKEYITKTNLPNGFKDRKPDWSKIYSELGKNHPFTKFLIDVEDGLQKILGVKSIGDLLGDNIGERENGDIVYFDPIGGMLAME